MKNSLSRPEKLSVKRFALSIYSNCQMRKCPPCKIVRSKWKTNLSKYRKPVICRAVMVATNACVYETFGISKRFPIKLQLLLIRAKTLEKPLTAKCFIHVVMGWLLFFQNLNFFHIQFQVLSLKTILIGFYLQIHQVFFYKYQIFEDSRFLVFVF